MKFLVVLVAFVAVASAQFRGFAQAPARAAAPGSEAAAQILRLDSDISPDGAYNYAYETSNGISAQEQGTPVNFGGNPPAIADVAQGSYSYTSPEGQLVRITYVANENGYQPQGDAIPTPPPVPAEIARSLEYLAKFAPRQ